ncbi:hypothetical protein D9613_008921 [Agrocybe pediades]|uniref:Mis12 domain-containing protein n=1 Tax=Agrocybe pediades TaxID=84607 RepID=A0A8H4QU35_9AGAR|nr:hypothetical protein D9613_008921 [Agrocybe pediades]
MPPQPQPQTSYSTPNSSLLLCEALGFSPQLLLDDIINIANNAVQDGVNGMEEFLEQWAEKRVAAGEVSDASIDATTHEVEQGLVAFQTLLEYHTDVAFDFFEAWSLRNIFMIPPDLPIVLPHQEGLDLNTTPEQEQEAMEEVEELRKRLDGQRKLNRHLTRAIRTSSRQLAQAEARLSRLSALASSSDTTLDTLEVLPAKFIQMFNNLSSLPPLDVSPTTELSEPGKRHWETSKTGYMNWAIGRLLVKGEGKEGVGHGAVDTMAQNAASIGADSELRRALESVGAVKKDLASVPPADEDGDDSRMEE